MKKWWSKLNKTTKVLIIIFIAFVLIGCAGGASKPEEEVKKEDAISEEEVKKEKVAEDGSLNYNDNEVSREDLASYCQENYLILKNLVSDNISLIDIWNYNEKMWDVGYYTKDGDQILMVQWNGKNKKTDDRIPFSCYVSAKSKDDIIVHQVVMNGTVLDGSLVVYDKDGKLIDTF